MDNTVALGIQPFKVDIATPLMQAAKIKQEQVETQQRTQAMQQDAAGQFARGVAVYADKPEFASKWAEGLDDLHSRGLMPTQAYQNLRDNPSPMVLQSILAQTQKPELALAQKQFEETQKQHAQTFGLESQKFEEEKRKTGVAENAPLSVAPGAAIIHKATGEPIYTNQEGTYTQEELAALAKQARAGDTSVFTNVGKGAQGPQDIRALRKEIVRQNNEAGISGEEQAMKNAEFFGVKAGQRTLGTKQTNIELAATEFKQVLPVVRAASQAVSRTNYPDLNKIIQAFEQKTGDPNIVKFGGGINTLVNLYARAISPNGAGTVSDKDHAREILQKAWSGGQFDAAVGMMEQEIDAALNSPGKVRDEMRARFLGGQGGASAAPAPPAAAAAPPGGTSGKTQSGVSWSVQ